MVPAYLPFTHLSDRITELCIRESFILHRRSVSASATFSIVSLLLERVDERTQAEQNVKEDH